MSENERLRAALSTVREMQDEQKAMRSLARHIHDSRARWMDADFRANAGAPLITSTTRVDCDEIAAVVMEFLNRTGS